VITREWFTMFASQEERGSHRPALWASLEATAPVGPASAPSPVLELGAGIHSTPFLSAYCEDRGRDLLTVEYTREWAPDVSGSQRHACRTRTSRWNGWSVVLVDHAPAEARMPALYRLSGEDDVGIIVVHDWNRPGYGFEEELYAHGGPGFRYMTIDTLTCPQRHTALFSNVIDVRALSLTA